MVQDPRIKYLPWVALVKGRPVLCQGSSLFPSDLLELGEQGVGPHVCGDSAVMVELAINAAEKVASVKVRVDGDWIYSGNPGNAVNFSAAAEKMRAEYALLTVPLGEDGKIPTGMLKGVKIEFHHPAELRVRELPLPRLVFVLDPDGYPCTVGVGQGMYHLDGMFSRAVDSLPFCPTFANGATVMVARKEGNPKRTVWEISPFPGSHIYTADPTVAPTHECAKVRYVRTTVGKDVMWTLESTGLEPTPIPAATPATT